ncbi:MAG: hypothetical protein EOO38_06005 [Cytophagaceae bacterium]|nr:MAG: hypothetical protein EOO38_06005 [Cytophagaceae bacterium]
MNKRRRKKHILKRAVLLTCGEGPPTKRGKRGDVYIDTITCGAWWFSNKSMWVALTRRWQAYARAMGGQ